jgi:hypothetical protein
MKFPVSKKAAPLLGPRFKEVSFGGLSGKAMEVTISPGEVALRELVTGNESEGHFFGFAASFVHPNKAFAEPNCDGHHSNP